MDLDVALSPGFADARLGLLMFALEGGSESVRNCLDLSRVAAEEIDPDNTKIIKIASGFGDIVINLPT